MANTDISDLPAPPKQSASDISDLPTPPREKSFGEKYVQPVTDVLNRGTVATTLGAAADIGNLPLQAIDYLSKKAGYPTKLASEKPFLGSEYIGEKMQEAGFVSPTRRPGAEFAASLLPAAITGGPALTRYAITSAKDLASLLTGKKVKEAYEGVKTAATSEGLAGRAALESEAASSTQAEKKAAESTKEIEEAKFATKEKLRKEADQADKQVNTSLNNISDKPVTDEQFGQFVAEKGKANVKAINETTERKAINEIKDPAFERAKTRYAQGDAISTNPKSAPVIEKAIADVRQQIADTPAEFRAGLEKKLNSLFGEEVPLSEAELRAAKLRSSITGEPVQTVKYKPLTMEQTEFLRRWAKDPILRERTGFGALDDIRMKQTGDTLQEAMIQYEPDIKRYIDTYRAGKQAEELALGGRTGEAAIEEFGTKPQNIANYYLDGTKTSADKLINLVGGKSEELTNQVAGKIRNDVQSLNAEQLKKYIQDKSGLLEAFPEIKQSLDTLSANKDKAEKLSRLFTGERKRLSEALGATESVEKLVGQGAQKLTKPIKNLQISLEQLNQATGKGIVPAAKQVILQLRSAELIDGKRYEELLSQLNNIGNSAEKAEKLRKTLRNVAVGTAVLSGVSYGPRKLFGLGY